MSTLDKMLRSPEDAPQHPVVRWVKTRIEAGDKFLVELQLDKSPLGSSVSGLCLLRFENGTEHPPVVYSWDDDLNSGFINLGVRAVNLEQEGLRFAMVMRTALRRVEREYGDGYMNGILVVLIDESDLGKQGEISKVRRLIGTSMPYADTKAYHNCREEVANAIGGLAKELRDKLKYNPDELKKIMDLAIAQYLDERFSISTMRNLGWIDENGRTIRKK
jgi:hypothetical protein